MTACQFQGYPSPASMRGTRLATVTRQFSAAPPLLPIRAAGYYFRQGIRGISSSPTPAIPTTSPSIRTPWRGLSPQSPCLRAFLRRTFAGLEGAVQTPTANLRSLLPFDPLGDSSSPRGSHDLRGPALGGKRTSSSEPTISIPKSRPRHLFQTAEFYALFV